MGFTSNVIAPGTTPSLEATSGEKWTPLFSHSCSFPPEIFREVMLNLIRNPNINSNHLFRADISLDCPYTEELRHISGIPRVTHFKDYKLKRLMVRTMIPRNIVVDKPLDQTCLFYDQTGHSGELLSLVVYLPHISSPSESPFYHPAVHGIGFSHKFDPVTEEGTISIHYSFFESEPFSAKLQRTAQHLLAVLHKHGQGLAAGYVKRVQHDLVLPQALVQNTYSRLKAKYARNLVQEWVETTDPGKHVFEDLGIAAFLIELWAEMYKDQDFPGFVDIGCGNGLLVHILLEEGYPGWGFDARKRKSWLTYSPKAQENLKELVLIPSFIRRPQETALLPNPINKIPATEAFTTTKLQNPDETPKQTIDAPKISACIPEIQSSIHTIQQEQELGIHGGIFTKGTFIISNHADELTPWTPILANLSESPFMMIPCCSHAFSGARFRAPPPKDAGASNSAYASLVAWVSKLAKDCGWVVEKEMLRIPSTRNTALIGRQRELPFRDVDVQRLVDLNGGAAGWEDNALRLVRGATRGH